MVGVRTRNKGLRQSEMVFKPRILVDRESDEPKPKTNRNGIRRVTTMKKIQTMYKNKLKKQQEKWWRSKV